MKIHAIETGKVRITEKWRIGQGTGLGRLANTLFDRTFTEWLPIYVWVIEHPEGVIVVDTGIPADANKPIWFPPHMRLVQRAAIFDITADQEIGPQLRDLGFSPADISKVVMTHLHQDHDGGLHYFPHAEVIISRAEWDGAVGLGGRLGGYLNHRWPKSLRPTLVDFTDSPLGSFPESYQLTSAGDMFLVPTPGHSAGHMSLILDEGPQSIFFAGDVTYSEELLLAGQLDGIGQDQTAMKLNYDRIIAFAAETPTVFLPSHDPRAAQRLAARQTMSPHNTPIWA